MVQKSTAETTVREPVRVTLPKRARESLDGTLSTNFVTNRNPNPNPNLNPNPIPGI